MKFSNKVMLITYPDSLGSNLESLNRVIQSYLKGAIGGIHILPFFPSTGDRGFSPTRYDQVDPQFGTWNNIEQLSQSYYLMFDLMVNHLSRMSIEFQDYLRQGETSPYADMFINWDKFWPRGRPSQKDIDLIYKRKDRSPKKTFERADGSNLTVWNTFGEEQIDLNVSSAATQRFLSEAINSFSNHGCTIVRLDAFAYAIKKLDANDFFVEPEIWDLLKWLSDQAAKNQMMILPEIHERSEFPRKVADKGYFTYDFALPMLVLYFLYSQDSGPLIKWLLSSPMQQFTTLDTHDGLGVVDVQGLLSDDQISFTTDQLYSRGSNEKRIYSGPEYKNLDIYQINTTYYSAVGEKDNWYLLARAIQIFAPGIPQIYYVGLLAGKNDLNLLSQTTEGRNINRHYYDEDEVAQDVQRPVVAKLLHLLRLRNTSPAFSLDGHFTVTQGSNSFDLIRSDASATHTAKLHVEPATYQFQITIDGSVFTL
ncbi:sucrose phosphorylase [Lacticaseibacillus hegangensis]|uniref:Sucrose phosphorylase n=1 Tax=Lacticaseibacillus hegangensis TaxID=2486010 RepID=A0ABW4CW91_9LACO|nr:sucrose phosphorylase [Lacticaseibacillus hegangensis]